MKIISNSGNVYILRFDAEEDVIEELGEFCKEERIEAGIFYGIGSCREAILAYYDLDRKTYVDKVLEDRLEVVNLLGNITKMENKIIIHAHGTVADSNFNTYGGHIKKLKVSATCEVILKSLSGRIERRYDSETGLNLLMV